MLHICIYQFIMKTCFVVSLACQLFMIPVILERVECHQLFFPTFQMLPSLWLTLCCSCFLYCLRSLQTHCLDLPIAAPKGAVGVGSLAVWGCWQSGVAGSVGSLAVWGCWQCGVTGCVGMLVVWGCWNAAVLWRLMLGKVVNAYIIGISCTFCTSSRLVHCARAS